MRNILEKIVKEKNKLDKLISENGSNLLHPKILEQSQKLDNLILIYLINKVKNK
ncbi:MAG: Spo0E family sporulation regulatory protein-aspartic acid phosphatase [Bacillota bacterium]|nr:Spo0E family sporulation regulatory protein-aspartic acid phosphatase [Bacillota bacterium]